MGDFKNTYGKTRVGLFLKNLAPNILDVAGGLTGIKAFNKISSAIDNSELSDDDKAQALELLRLDIENEKQITERHKNDMNSDSWLSKNIRPLSLAFLLFLLFICIILDSALDSFKVDEAYITLLKTLSLTAFVFYFGGRDIQKGIKNINNRYKDE